MDVYGNTSVTLAVIAILGSTVGALVYVIKFMFNKVIPMLEQQIKVTGKLLTATSNNTSATKSADEYLRQRNGRDAEKHQELLEVTKEIPLTLQRIADTQAESIIKAIKIKEQHVEHQHVEISSVEHEDIKKLVK